MKLGREENLEAETIDKSWLLLADPNFLDENPILVKLPNGWLKGANKQIGQSSFGFGRKKPRRQAA